MAKNTESKSLVYEMDEKPPIGASVVYGFQHIFAMILGSITTAVIIGTTVGLTTSQIGLLIGYINVAVGIATIIQVMLGVRLPVIQGSTSGHIPAYLALGSLGVSLYSDPLITMQYLGGALLVGAVFQSALGFLNVLKWVSRLISPMTVGIIIMMIGLGLWPVITEFIGDAWHYAMIVIIMVISFSFAFGVMTKTMSLFLAVIIAYAAAMVGTWLEWFPEKHLMYVNLQTIAESKWFTVPEFFPWGAPKFNMGFIFAMSIPYLTASLESFGDYMALSKVTGTDPPKIKQISRGIAAEGVGSIISSVLGGSATSTFSQNIGVIRLSGIASRFVCIVAGIILLFIGIVGKFGAFMAEIPEVILGAVYLVAFGVLAMTGLELILRAKINISRNQVLIGTSLMLGLSLPSYMKENPIQLENTSLMVFINVVLATPMMVSGLWAFLLDNILPGTPEERGMSGWLTGTSGKRKS
ncbi:solute carrier family 23 protein [Daejeonella sp. JGW-45]|uniref:uracil-xanthine permease family protein n=1 Tax=Daejeonella sp. JGW-45 TaxID=3034148 RepID=UPI0023ED32B6|nr:solute carrier family 23 protein [Daejeonella sp. JGW-45]